MTASSGTRREPTVVTMKGTRGATVKDMTMEMMRLMEMTMNTMIKITLKETLSQTIKSNALQKGVKKLDKSS